MELAERKTAEALVEILKQRGETLSSAESCTGGLIAKLITDIGGSSAVFFGGCVTYTNEVKRELLGVDEAIIQAYTEVSEPCAIAMAKGVRERLRTTVGVSTTGYAGPTGGTERDPVGTVYIAVARERSARCIRFQAPKGADRDTVRRMAAVRAMELVIEE